MFETSTKATQPSHAVYITFYLSLVAPEVCAHSAEACLHLVCHADSSCCAHACIHCGQISRRQHNLSGATENRLAEKGSDTSAPSFSLLYLHTLIRNTPIPCIFMRPYKRNGLANKTQIRVHNCTSCVHTCLMCCDGIHWYAWTFGKISGGSMLSNKHALECVFPQELFRGPMGGAQSSQPPLLGPSGDPAAHLGQGLCAREAFSQLHLCPQICTERARSTRWCVLRIQEQLTHALEPYSLGTKNVPAWHSMAIQWRHLMSEHCIFINALGVTTKCLQWFQMCTEDVF